MIGVVAKIFWAGVLDKSLDVFSRKVALAALLGGGGYLFHSTFSLATRISFNEVGFITLMALGAIAVQSGRDNKMFGLRRVVVKQSKNNQAVAQILLLLLVAIGWLSFYPVVEGEKDHYRFKVEKVKAEADRREQVKDLMGTGDVELLHRLVVRQFKNGDLMYIDHLLNKIDEKIPEFRDVSMQRAVLYQLSSGTELDVGLFKAYIQRYLSVDRYYFPAMHWMARVAAWEQDREHLVGLVGDLFRVVMVSSRVVPKWGAENFKIEVRSGLDGMAFQFSREGGVLLIGESVLDGMLEDFQSVKSREEARELMLGYSEKIYISLDPDGLSEYQRDQFDVLFSKFISRLSSWSMVPSV